MNRRQFLKGFALTSASVALFRHKATDVPLPIDRPVLVAAFDSSTETQRVADIRCNGFADNQKIQRATDAGHLIHMAEGTFHFTEGGIRLRGPGNHHIVGYQNIVGSRIEAGGGGAYAL